MFPFTQSLEYVSKLEAAWFNSKAAFQTMENSKKWRFGNLISGAVDAEKVRLSLSVAFDFLCACNSEALFMSKLVSSSLFSLW